MSAFEDHPGGLNLSQQKLLSLPRRRLGGPDSDPVYRFSGCRQYDVNFTELWSEGGGRWPDGPDPDWGTVKCREGWMYDTSEFADTLVTEVSK